MSTDFYPEATIGVPIKWDQIEITEFKEIDNCDHAKPEGAKHCPDCGKVVGKQKLTRTTLKEFFKHKDAYESLGVWGHPKRYTDYFMQEGKIGDFDVKWKFNNYPSGFVGVQFGEKKLSLKPGEYEEIREKLKNTLEPLGLWNEEQFGIHSWGWVSF